MKCGLDTVVIADDLTGAADTGVQFSAEGAAVYLLPVETLVIEHPWIASASGICVYPDTRRRSPQAAADRLRFLARTVSELHPRWIYKKIDSCLRGNLGAEIDVLLEELGFEAALVAPALPAQGRTTVGGIHRVYGRPLAETEFAKDPVAPVTCSAIADVLAGQSRYPVGRIDISDYGDPERLRHALQRERRRGSRLIACDALEQAHLDQAAGLVERSGEDLLPVGSAGLAASLSKRLFPGSMPRPKQDRRRERLLMVCGTGSRTTQRQLDALFNKHPGLNRALEADWLAAATDRERRRCAAELSDAWHYGALALRIHPPPPPGPKATPGRVVAGLAELALKVLLANPVDTLFVSGGDTADALRAVAKAEAIRLEGELLPGLVLGHWLGGAVNGLPVVTKAGAFGQEQTLIELYERLCGETRS